MRQFFLLRIFFSTIPVVVFSSTVFGQIVLNDGFYKEIILTKTVVSPLENENDFTPPEDTKFRAFNSHFLKGNVNKNWLKFSIKNTGSSIKEIYIGGNDFEKTELYAEGVAIKAVDFPLVSFFQQTLQPGEEKNYYLKGINETQTSLPRVKFPLQVLSAQQFAKEYEAPKSHTYIALGATLILGLYHLFLFLVTRDRSYAFYFLFISTISGFGLCLVPQFAEPFYGEMVPTRGIPTVLGISSLIFNILFFRSIFEIKKRFPSWDKFFVYIIGFAVGSVFLNLLGFPAVSTFINIPAAIGGSILMTWLSFRLLKERSISVSFFFTGYVIFSVSTVILVGMLLEFLPTTIFGLTVSGQLQLFYAIAFVLLATALGSRISQMQKKITEEELNKARILREQEAEKRKILHSQNKELEEKVASRTTELQERTKELETSIKHLKTTQTQLVESEKMASLGQLTAGVAHEINNPINFVANGISNLQENYNDLKEALSNYLSLNPENATPEALQAVLEKNKKLEVEYAIEDVKNLFKSINNGVKRTTKIAGGLRSFTGTSSGNFVKSDINQNLDSTIEILKSNFKNRVEIVKDYGELPPIYCEEGKINQVFLNIINNAGQAIAGKGEIHIKTRLITDNNNDKKALIEIRDTGSGMSEKVRKRIFEPFFTTKDVGIGTGLGLSITYGIIEEHKGKIEVKSEEGKGTTFFIYLPQNAPSQ